ncbi:unknown [Corallococcus sp. CAG:1435]|nr:unknown [Corallococcus sp. CAG:1435]
MFYRLLLQSLRAGKSFLLIFYRSFFGAFHNAALFTALRNVFAFGCLLLRFVVFRPHALSLFISCAVWYSAGKSFLLIFYRSFFGAFHNVALFTALPESFCIWLLFCASCCVSSSRFTICAVWCSAEKSVPFIFTALFLLVLRCNAFYK